MPIPGFSLIAPPEFVTAAEAVEMVVERFKSSACTRTEACAWLSEQVRHCRLKLLWADTSPEYLGGLHLAGEGNIFIPGLPGARVLDDVEWRAGELRRRLRIPKAAAREAGEIDPRELRQDQLLAYDRDLLARYGGSFDPDDPEECVTKALTYRFTVNRASLVAILDAVPALLHTVPVLLDTVPVPLLEAAGVIADR